MPPARTRQLAAFVLLPLLAACQRAGAGATSPPDGQALGDAQQSHALPGAAPPAPADVRLPRPRTLAFIGDSLTAGEGVPRAQAFPGLLAAHCGLPVVAQGRSGWATTSYLRRQTEVIAAFPADADALVIQLGANDLRLHGHNAATVAACARNLETIVELLRARAPLATVVVLGSPDVFPERLTPRLQAAFTAEAPRYLAELRAAYRALAARRGWRFIDTADALRPEETLDGAHPDAAGHRRLAAAIRAATGW